MPILCILNKKWLCEMCQKIMSFDLRTALRFFNHWFKFIMNTNYESLRKLLSYRNKFCCNSWNFSNWKNGRKVWKTLSKLNCLICSVWRLLHFSLKFYINEKAYLQAKILDFLKVFSCFHRECPKSRYNAG